MCRVVAAVEEDRVARIKARLAKLVGDDEKSGEAGNLPKS